MMDKRVRPARQGLTNSQIEHMRFESRAAAARRKDTPPTVRIRSGRRARCHQSSRRATTHCKLTQILNRHQGKTTNKQYMKVGFIEAKSWMERRLSNMKYGIMKEEVNKLANGWTLQREEYELDRRIVEIEAAEIAKRWHRYHVLELGVLEKERRDGILRCFGGQLNSASSQEVSDSKIDEINWVVDEWDLQLGGFSEVGVNWKKYPSSYNFASWFGAERNVRAITCHNTNDCSEKSISRHQPGGIALMAMKEAHGYVKKKCPNFRGLWRWLSWLCYVDPAHPFRIVVAYNVGRPKPKGVCTMYQQTLMYIQEHDLDTNPRRLFEVDFLSVLTCWQKRGEQILVFIDMNKHILQGPLARKIMNGLGFLEATHVH